MEQVLNQFFEFVTTCQSKDVNNQDLNAVIELLPGEIVEIFAPIIENCHHANCLNLIKTELEIIYHIQEFISVSLNELQICNESVENMLAHAIKELAMQMCLTCDSKITRDYWINYINPNNRNNNNYIGISNVHYVSKEMRNHGAIAKRIAKLIWQQLIVRGMQLFFPRNKDEKPLIAENVRKNQKCWLCYYCGKFNKKTDNKCDCCDKGLNPLYFSIKNKSKHFTVDPDKFGIYSISPTPHFKTRWEKRNRHQGFENDGIIFDGKDYVRIIIDVPSGIENHFWMYEICCQQLTFGEFKAILQEMWDFEMAHREQCEVLISCYCPFFGMTDNDIIPPIKTLNNINNEFDNVYYIQEGTDFIVSDFNIHGRGIEKEIKCRSSCNVVKIMKGKAGNDNFLDQYNNGQLHNIENHLVSNDHGSLLPFGDCKYGINCEKFIKLCQKLSKNIDIKDRIHMHLFRHPSHHLVINNNNNNNNSNNNNNTTGQLFEYIDSSTYKDPIGRDFVQWRTAYNRDNNVNILLLMYEVIKNGYEKELVLQQEQAENDSDVTSNTATKIHFNTVLTKHGILDIMEKISQNDDTRMFQRINSKAKKKFNSTNWDDLMNELKQKYTILNKLIDKMKHPTHVSMKSPLEIEFMFAIILYTDTNCYSSLDQELRKYNQVEFSFVKKWKYFDHYLYWAICLLSSYEKCDANIFSGLSGVYLEAAKFDDKYSKSILLKTYQSFSKDLSVAEDFRSSDGIIIGINLKGFTLDFDDFNNLRNQLTEINVQKWIAKQQFKSSSIHMGLLYCDVSWISRFPHEREVLVAKHSILPINSKQIYWPQSISNKSNVKRQYVVCDVCMSDNVSFADIFGKFKKFGT